MNCGIALGSNIGDRLENLRHARNEIAARHGELRCSKIYETEPVGCDANVSPFLNAVVEFEYDGVPIPLLEELRTIENAMGRQPICQRNAPRIIDLDILYLGDLVISNDKIATPHPRLCSRRFVLAPLRDIRPELILPGLSESVAELLAKLPQTPAVKVFSEAF